MLQSKTVCAKILNPELFDYRIYEYEVKEDDTIIVDGGRDFSDINGDILKDIKRVINDYNSWDYEYYYCNSIKSFLQDMFPKKKNGKRLSFNEMHHIKELLDKDNDTDTILYCLQLIYNTPYKKVCLKGCCQGDVVYLYCPEKTSQERIDWLEAWYFGTGSEIEVDESDDGEISPEDIFGPTIYTAKWNVSDIKDEIRKQFLLSDDTNIILYQFSGYRKIAQYKKVED